jgi:hypothetical protein
MKTNHVLMFRKILVVYRENHMKHNNAVLFNFKAGAQNISL